MGIPGTPAANMQISKRASQKQVGSRERHTWGWLPALSALPTGAHAYTHTDIHTSTTKLDLKKKEFFHLKAQVHQEQHFLKLVS